MASCEKREWRRKNSKEEWRIVFKKKEEWFERNEELEVMVENLEKRSLRWKRKRKRKNEEGLWKKNNNKERFRERKI